ncbi:hypothetical protein [Nocardia sp. NPDC003345]
MRSNLAPHGLCVIRLEAQSSHTLIAVVTDYGGVSGPEHRRNFLDDADGATEVVRDYLLGFLTGGDG